MLPQGFSVLEICAFILDFNEEMGLFITITIIMIMIMIDYDYLQSHY